MARPPPRAICPRPSPAATQRQGPGGRTRSTTRTWEAEGRLKGGRHKLCLGPTHTPRALSAHAPGAVMAPIIQRACRAAGRPIMQQKKTCMAVSGVSTRRVGAVDPGLSSGCGVAAAVATSRDQACVVCFICFRDAMGRIQRACRAAGRPIIQHSCRAAGVYRYRKPLPPPVAPWRIFLIAHGARKFCLISHGLVRITSCS
jgi:hypothetical protein